MAREKSTAAANLLRELFTLEVYKRSQGRIARQVTFAALAVTLAWGAYRMSVFTSDSGAAWRYGLPTVVLIVGLWVVFRVVNVSRFADFLIAVEAEMSKVSWPDRGMVVRSSVVVLFTIFFLAVVIYSYDLFWSFFLSKLGIFGA